MRRYLILINTTRHKILAIWLAAGFVVAAHFNSCGPVAFDAGQASSKLVDLQASAAITINNDDAFTNNQQVTLTLSGRNATEVYVTDDSTCSDGGQWEPFLPTRGWTLSDANRDVRVYAKFRNPDERLETGCLHDTIIHDDEKPTVMWERPSQVTKIAAPVINFTASDSLSGLDKMLCEWPGQAAVPCNFVATNGNLAEGRYAVTVQVTDKAGNASDPAVHDLLVDRTPPQITILSAPNALSNISSASFTFNIVDESSGIASSECAMDNKANYAACQNSFASTVNEGAHKFFIRATDFAGNTTEIERDFAIDQTAPTVTITAYPPDFTKDRNARFEFVGVDGNVAITEFQCRVDSAAFADCTSPQLYDNVADGLHVFEVRGRDTAGNFSAVAARSWYVDTVAPVVAILSGPAAYISTTTANFTYSATDNGSGILSVQCSVDGGAFADCPPTNSTLNNLAEGPHSFQVRATDRAGNQGMSDVHSFIVDRTLPTIQFVKVPAAFTNATSFNFEFLAQDNRGVQRVECRLDAGVFVPCNSLSAHMVSSLSEGGHTFAVRAVDVAENVSAPVTHNWVVDLTGPVIAYFQLPPANSPFGSVINLGFTATDAVSNIKAVTCTLNGAATACTSGVVKTFNNLAAGNYVFEVRAEDNAGNVSTDVKNFGVAQPVLKNQLVEVKGNSKVDILVVMDNSGSMAGEMANMGARFNNFLDQIKLLDWQLGIATTDVSSNAARKDGRLIPLEYTDTVASSDYILRSNVPQAQAQAIFNNTIQMPTNGSANEYGFRASIRAIERAFDNAGAQSAPNKELFRADAGLAIVLVSDAADTSGTLPEAVTAQVRMRWGEDKPFVFHSIVIPESAFTNPNGNNVSPNDPCGPYRESVRLDGRAYHALSQATGGVKGTACSDDYSGQLADMGKITAELVNSVTLACQPVDANNDGVVNVADIQVRTMAGVVITNFTLDGTKLTFVDALPLGENQITYYCVQ